MQDSLTLAVSGRRNTFSPSLGRRLLPNLSSPAPAASHSSDANLITSTTHSSVDAVPGSVAQRINAADPISIKAAATTVAVVNSTPAITVTGVIPSRGNGTINNSSIGGSGLGAGGGPPASSSSILSSPVAPRVTFQAPSTDSIKRAAATPAVVSSTLPQSLASVTSPAVIQRTPMRFPPPSPASSAGLTIKALMTDKDVQSRLKRSVNTDDSDTPMKKRITAPPPTPSLFSPTSHASVQVKIINGRISLDEASLEVSANAGPEPDEAFGQVVENSGLVSCIAGRREYCKVWGIEETDNLHKAIGMFGMDFQTIAVYLGTGRTRKQVLAKFKREEQQNPQRLQDSIKNRSGCSSWRELQEDLIRRAQGESLQLEDGDAADGSVAGEAP
jgi:hypothetical protein